MVGQQLVFINFVTGERALAVNKLKTTLFTLFGPGIVFAATSIGVSHVVQATRAGAYFGFSLIGLILLAHLVKLPFFQIGPRYAAATGESLLEAFQRQGNWVYYFCIAFTFSTMFIVMAAVTIVAAGLLANIFPGGLELGASVAVILASTLLILMAGGYKGLDWVLKIMMVLFALSCLITFAAALLSDLPQAAKPEVDLTSAASIAFMVALVGWMPTTVEVSIWHSLWVVEQQRVQGRAKDMAGIQQFARDKAIDFNVSYLFCFLFAIIFLVLGAKLLHGHGQELSDSAIGFSAQLIGVFTSALGEWSKPVVSLLIFLAMYSTVLAVADGFGLLVTRVAEAKLSLPKHKHKTCFRIVLVVVALGGALVIALFSGQLKALIDFATTVSFVAAPMFAWFNLRAMQMQHVPEVFRLHGFALNYARLCLAALAAFSLFFLFWRFG